MPFYDFLNTETGETLVDQRMSIAEMETFLEQNQQWRIQITSAIPVGDPHRMGLIKPPESFRDLMRTIKSKHIHSTIKTD